MRLPISPEAPIVPAPMKETLGSLELGVTQMHSSGFLDPLSNTGDYLFTTRKEENQGTRLSGLHETYGNTLSIQVVKSRPGNLPTPWYYSDYVGLEIEGYL